jgi:hypothetical protein
MRTVDIVDNSSNGLRKERGREDPKLRISVEGYDSLFLNKGNEFNRFIGFPNLSPLCGFGLQYACVKPTSAGQCGSGYSVCVNEHFQFTS